MAAELRMALLDLLRKAELEPAADFLRDGVRVLAQELMELEVSQHLGAALDVKILVARRQRIERRDFLHALGNQDAAGWVHRVSFRTSQGCIGQVGRLPSATRRQAAW